MKKLLFAVLALVLMSSASFAGTLGFAFKGGIGGNDPKTLKEIVRDYGGDLSKSPLFFNFELLYEKDLLGHYDADAGSLIQLGFKLGIDIYGENKLENSLYIDTKENTLGVPLSVYLKYNNTVSFYVGGGISYFRTTMTYGAAERYDSRFSPHLISGIEYRISPSFGLGLDFTYIYNAKVEKGGTVYSDRSGLQGALAARFYFL